MQYTRVYAPERIQVSITEFQGYPVVQILLISKFATAEIILEDSQLSELKKELKRVADQI